MHTLTVRSFRPNMIARLSASEHTKQVTMFTFILQELCYRDCLMPAVERADISPFEISNRIKDLSSICTLAGVYFS